MHLLDQSVGDASDQLEALLFGRGGSVAATAYETAVADHRMMQLSKSPAASGRIQSAARSSTSQPAAMSRLRSALRVGAAFERRTTLRPSKSEARRMSPISTRIVR